MGSDRDMGESLIRDSITGDKIQRYRDTFHRYQYDKTRERAVYWNRCEYAVSEPI